MTTFEELLKKQKELEILFDAWMTEKKKYEVVTYRQSNGDLVEHYPDGKIRVVQYAQ